MLVFVHASLSSFGIVEGGAQNVVAAILDLLGPRGTLVVPIFRDYFLKGPKQIWDRKRSPSKMGAVSESVRTWPGSRHSAHPTHPIAAIGPLSEELTAMNYGSAFGVGSVFKKLVERNAAILLMGVNYSVCTLMHVAEEARGVPYRRWVKLNGLVVDGIIKRVSIPFYRRKIGYSNCFSRCGRDLEDLGQVAWIRIGRCKVRRIWARELFEYAVEQLRENPMYLARRSNPFEIGMQILLRAFEVVRTLMYQDR
jgi:aminoglycoside 3-N-acetyltransferase